MLQLILLSLATWRLTALLVYEAGPRGIFAYLREVSDAIGGPLECFWCTSGWVSLLASCFIETGWWENHLWWWASWALAVLLEEVRQNYFPQLEDCEGDAEEEE